MLRPEFPSFLFPCVTPARSSASPCDHCSQISSSHVRSFVMAGLDIFLRAWTVSVSSLFSTVTFSSPLIPKSKWMFSPWQLLIVMLFTTWHSAGRSPQSFLQRPILPWFSSLALGPFSVLPASSHCLCSFSLCFTNF